MLSQFWTSKREFGDISLHMSLGMAADIDVDGVLDAGMSNNTLDATMATSGSEGWGEVTVGPSLAVTLAISGSEAHGDVGSDLYLDFVLASGTDGAIDVNSLSFSIATAFAMAIERWGAADIVMAIDFTIGGSADGFGDVEVGPSLSFTTGMIFLCAEGDLVAMANILNFVQTVAIEGFGVLEVSPTMGLTMSTVFE